MVDVGLQDVDRAHFDQLAAAIRRDQTFAGGDGHGGAAGDPRHGLHVLGRARLFDEEQVHRLDLFANDRRHAGAGLCVKIDGDIDVRPEPFAQSLDVAHGPLDFGARADPFVILRQAALETRNAFA